MQIFKTPLSELNKKLEELKKLGKQITLHNRQFLTDYDRQEEKLLQERLEFRLNELVMECKMREADIRLEIYRQVLAVLNQEVTKK